MTLGQILRATKEQTKASLGDLTVLSPQNDPFRMDTPANHAKGQWFRDNMEACGLLATDTPIHNRGVHYAFVSTGKIITPNGSPYVNDLDCWGLLEEASNVARWLGYVSWDKIFDARNSEPIIQIREVQPLAYRIRVETGIFLPDAESLKPRIRGVGFDVPQPYRLAFYGEKTSLGNVLKPMADYYEADLYLPSGEISNSLLATMAKVGADDGREMVVFIFADCDPAGYQMATSIGHKLRAFKDSCYPDLKFRVLTPALTVEQVTTLGLPSTPLKETELRAAGWRERYGVEQTEIDALATLKPDALKQIVRESVKPFFDKTLKQRSDSAKREWEEQAQVIFERQLDRDMLDQIYVEAVKDLERIKERLEAIEVATDGLELDFPAPLLPKPVLPDLPVSALVSSDMDLSEHIKTLRARKDYGGA